MAESNNNQVNKPIIELLKVLDPKINDAMKILQENDQYEELEQFISSYRRLKSYVNKMPSSREEMLEQMKDVDKIEQIVKKIQAFENRLASLEKKVDRNKKDTDKKIERNKKETDAIIVQNKKDTDEKIDTNHQEIDTKLNLMTALIVETQRKENDNAERLTNHDRELSDIRREIAKINERFDLFLSTMHNQGAKEARNFLHRLKNAKNVPNHSPEQLETILKLIDDSHNALDADHHITKRWTRMIQDASQDSFLSVARAGVEAGLVLRDCNVKFHELTRDDEGKAQAGKLLEAFGHGLLNQIKTFSPTSDTLKLAVDAIKIGVAVGKLIYKIHLANKIEREVEESWKAEVDDNMEEMLSMLKRSTKEWLDYTVQQYIFDQYCYYGRDDVEFITYDGLVYGNNTAPYYERIFKSIPDYLEKIPEYTDISRAIKVFKYNMNMERFDIKPYLKDENEKSIRRFMYLFKAYLAVNERGEFRKNLSGIYPPSAQNSERAAPKTLLSKYHASANFLLVAYSVLTLTAYSWAELAKRRRYHNNTTRLRDYMRKLLISHSSDECKDIINQLVHLSRLRFYNEASGNELGQFCYELLVTIF